MKHKKHIFIGALSLLAMAAVSLAVSFGGLQLASAESAAAGGDRLIGVLITDKPLDLFDFEGYLNDHVDTLLNEGGEISMSDTQKYGGKLYATRIETENTLENGLVYYRYDYDFPVEGLYALYRLERSPDDEEGCFTSSGSEDLETYVSVMNDYLEKLEVTIYVAPSREDPEESEDMVVYHINPIYEDAQGNVYAMEGSGIGYSVDGDHPDGEMYSQTISETTTVNENGKISEETTSIITHIVVKSLVEEVVVFQMDEDNQLLRQDSYAPENVPESFTPEGETAYLVIESRGTDNNTGEEKIQREICSRDMEYAFFTYCHHEGMVSARQRTDILWEEGER